MDVASGVSENFATTLQEALSRSPLTLERLSARLGDAGTPLTPATLSYWANGRSVPARRRSREAVEHLERLLGLEPGTLLNALDEDRGAPRWQPLPEFCGREAREELVRILSGWGMTLDQRTGLLNLHDSLVLGPDGHRLQQTSHALMQALAPELDRTIMVLRSPGPRAVPTEIEMVGGGRLGRRAELTTHHLVLLELHPRRALVAGERFHVSYRLQWTSPDPIDRFSRGLPSPARRLVTDLTVDGPAPVRAWREEAGPATAHPAAHQVVDIRDPAPVGLHTLCWKPDQQA